MTPRLRLARREREIADLVGNLWSYQQIAQHLGLAYESVRSCVNRIAARIPGDDDGRGAYKRLASYIQSERANAA